MNRNLWIVLLSSTCTAIICLLSFYHLFEPKVYYINSAPVTTPSAQNVNFTNILQEHYRASTPHDFIKAAKLGKASAVYVKAIPKGSKIFQSASTGSGVIISPDGYIATNYHVIKDAQEIEVLLGDNREFSAKVIGSDIANDLALLKIEVNDLDFAIFGNSDSLQVGEWVMAVGNPFGLEFTVTAGIVSAKARDIKLLQDSGIESFIQTDAAVNPGNSGGALVDTRGQVIGINSAIMAKSGNYEGYSFAIPSNLAQKILFDLRNYGAVQRGWLGVSIVEIDDEKAKQLNLPKAQGVLIMSVNKDGAAYDAGLSKGDVITAINNKEFDSSPAFMETIAQFRPGDKIELEYRRDGEKKLIQVVLKNQLNTTDYIAIRKDPILTNLGFELRDLSKKEKESVRKEGIYVVSVFRESTIGATNMDPGYIITKFNNKRVRTVDQLLKILKDTQGQVMLEGYYDHLPKTYPYVFEID